MFGSQTLPGMLRRGRSCFFFERDQRSADLDRLAVLNVDLQNLASMSAGNLDGRLVRHQIGDRLALVSS